MQMKKSDYVIGALFLVFFGALMFYNRIEYAGYLMGISGIGMVLVSYYYKRINGEDKKSGAQSV